MKSCLIDTSCLISYVTDRNPSQQAMAARVFEEAAGLKLVVFVISNVITEFVHVLLSVYGRDGRFVAELIADLLKTPGIEFREDYALAGILEVWPDDVKDFGDAVLAAAARTLGAPVLTFDKDFAKQLEALQIAGELLDG